MTTTNPEATPPTPYVITQVSEPELTGGTLVYAAWHEDYDMWDGNEIYADPDTARQASAWYYATEEYTDPADIPAGQLSWNRRCGEAWDLYDGDRQTPITVMGRTVWESKT